MAHTLHTEITINASAEIVWNELINHTHYPEWNPFLKVTQGDFLPNKRITVEIKPANSKAMIFYPIITEFKKNERLEWLGNFIIKGIFDGRHQFEIEPISESQVRFIHQEHFTGLLVPFMKGSLMKNTLEGFEMMNHALKIRSEKVSNFESKQ